MPVCSTAIVVLPAIPITIGSTLLFVARIRRKAWHVCSARVLSVQSRDSDWDIAQIRFAPSAQSVTTSITVPSEFGFLRRRGELVSIRYDPASPSEAYLESSPGRLKLYGMYLVGSGAIVLAFSLVMLYHGDAPFCPRGSTVPDLIF